MLILRRIGRLITAHSRAFLILALVLLFVSALFSLVTLTPSYRKCESEGQRYTSNHRESEFFQKTDTLFTCEGVALDSNAALLTALATIIMAVFTGTLWFVTYEAVRIANAEFISTHRPKLLVRRLRIDTPILGETVVIKFDLVNIGDTKATIVRLERFMQRQGLNPQHPDIDWAEVVPSGEVIEGGHAAEQVCDTHFVYANESSMGFIPNYLRVGGEIRYADDNGVIRRVAFLRVALPPGGARFRLLDPPDPDFEYAD
jgi:hypothetical protein